MAFRQFIGSISAATLGLILAVSPASAQSADASIKMTGIQGSSTIQGKQGEIVVLSYSWGVMNPSTVAAKGGAGAGKATFSDFFFMMGSDKAVPQLFAKTAMGDYIPEATFTVFRGTDGKFQDLLEVKFEDVLLTSFQTAGSSELPTYSVSISFGKITLVVYEQRPNGTYVKGQAVTWDIKTNTP